MSSASGPPLPLRFIDFLEVLMDRGYEQKAKEYGTAILVECLLRGIHDVENLTFDEALYILRAPPTPLGWDNHYWGKAVLE